MPKFETLSALRGLSVWELSQGTRLSPLTILTALHTHQTADCIFSQHDSNFTWVEVGTKYLQVFGICSKGLDQVL